MDSRYQALDDEETSLSVQNVQENESKYGARVSWRNVLLLVVLIAGSIAAVSYGGVISSRGSVQLEEAVVPSTPSATVLQPKSNLGGNVGVGASSQTLAGPLAAGATGVANGGDVPKKTTTMKASHKIYTKTDSPTSPPHPNPSAKPTRYPTINLLPNVEPFIEPTLSIIPTVEIDGKGDEKIEFKTTVTKAASSRSSPKGKHIYTKTESPTKAVPTPKPTRLPTLAPVSEPSAEPSPKPTVLDSATPSIPVNTATGSPTPWWYRFL